MFEDGNAPSSEGGAEAIVSYTLTLNDGTVLRNALPEVPTT